MKIDLEDHLEKLVKEWVKGGQPLSNALEPLNGQGQYLVSDDMEPRDVVGLIQSDLSAIGERGNLQRYLERSQEAREFPLESLLLEFHPPHPPPGRRIRVVFRDGKVLVGTTTGYQPGRPGFFVVPADASSNIERCYAVAAATQEISFL